MIKKKICNTLVDMDRLSISSLHDSFVLFSFQTCSKPLIMVYCLTFIFVLKHLSFIFSPTFQLIRMNCDMRKHAEIVLTNSSLRSTLLPADSKAKKKKNPNLPLCLQLVSLTPLPSPPSPPPPPPPSHPSSHQRPLVLSI